MGKPIKVTPNVYEDRELKFIFNDNSDKHYCFNGVKKEHAFGEAWDRVRDKMNANKKNGCCKWPVIDIAVVPHPKKTGLFIVDDRSEWVR